MTFPVSPVPVTSLITTLFAMTDRVHAKPHNGLDFAVSVGTPIRAPMDGVVSRKFTEEGRNEKGDLTGGGNCLELTHPNGLKTMYLHLSAYSTTLGSKVKAGDVIGISGGAKNVPGSGSSTGPHLHWEVRDMSNNRLDPLRYLPGVWNLHASLAKMVGKTSVKGGPAIGGLALLGLAAGAYFLWRRWKK